MMTSSATAALSVLVLCAPIHVSAGGAPQGLEATTALTLDHNRLLIDADIQQADGQWRPARLWVDTGNPAFMVSSESVAALGFAMPPGAAATGAPGDARTLVVEQGGTAIRVHARVRRLL